MVFETVTRSVKLVSSTLSEACQRRVHLGLSPVEKLARQEKRASVERSEKSVQLNKGFGFKVLCIVFFYLVCHGNLNLSPVTRFILSMRTYLFSRILISSEFRLTSLSSPLAAQWQSIVAVYNCAFQRAVVELTTVFFAVRNL